MGGRRMLIYDGLVTDKALLDEVAAGIHCMVLAAMKSFYCYKQFLLLEELAEAARTMLIFSRAPLFLWAEVIATACFTQNRSIIDRRFNKTPYELINGRKTDISFLHVFGALCYPKNDRKDIRKLGAKGDISFFIGYSVDSRAYRFYNRRTKKIMETMNVSLGSLYELINDRKPDISFLYVFGALCYPKNDREDIGKLGAKAMAFEQRSSKPRLQSMTSGQISLGFVLTYAPSTITTQQPTEGELDLLFQAMYDDYISGQPSAAQRTVPAPQAQQAQQQGTQASLQPETVANNVPNAMFDANSFVNPFATSSTTTYDDYIGGQPSATVRIVPTAQESQDRQTLMASTTIADTAPTPTNSSSHATNIPITLQDAKPTEKQLKEVKMIFHYLWGTVDTGLWYTKNFGFELTGFSDANYAGCKDIFKSTSGGAQFLGEKLLTDYGFNFKKIPIYCDLKSAIAISCNPVQHSRTKHITVRYHFKKEHVEKGTIELYFVKMDYQLADLFTKALPADRFNYLTLHLGMRSLSPYELDRLAKSQ
nr:hypothetical protein [Tanacetum cinerariifolium]